MQSNNPILNRVETHADYSQPMTVQGAIQKSVLLTVIAAVVGMALFLYCFMTLNISLAYAATLVGAIGGLILGLIATFKPNTARTLAIPYALFEGAFLGGVSVIFQLKYPGVPLQALLATFVTTLVMFGLYRFQIIRATEKFKSVVMSASIAIAIVFVVQMVMRLAFGSSIPFLFENNLLGLGFAAFVAVIASLNLILDFDLIESAAAQHAPKAMEWLCGIALLATLVWMYYSFLRLVETRTAIAVLLNMPVQQLNIDEPKRLPRLALPSIAAGLPADILSRRPDLKAAELRLRESLATKDATTASYYPSISLTGNLGSSSTSLTQLLKNPALTLGASLSLPFLQYNDMKRDLEVSQLDYEKAIVQYRQTLYQAFADVENALSARTELSQQVQLQQRNLELAEKVERLTQVRYRYGAVALKTLLDQQETTRTARLTLVNTKQSQYNAYVTLMQALGGSPIQQLPQ
jgi:uncharacterized YccA/Bax inhibitor family protein